MNLVRFFDPYFGDDVGCPGPVPEPVRQVLTMLDGKTMPLHAALSQIRAACSEGDEVIDWPISGHNMIILSSGPMVEMNTRPPLPIRRDNWRLIYFQEVP